MSNEEIMEAIATLKQEVMVMRTLLRSYMKIHTMLDEIAFGEDKIEFEEDDENDL